MTRPPGSPGDDAPRTGGFTGVVLTGGRSRRMGRDKALLDPGDGGPVLAARALAALRDAGATRCLAVGGDLEAHAALGFETVPDEPAVAGTGPLGAVAAAVTTAVDDIVVVLSCDLPAIDAATVMGLVDRLRAAPAADAVVPLADGRRQVLVAAYRRAAGAALAASFAGGERSLSRALGHLAVVEWTGADPDRLVDLDRPEDVDHYARRTKP